MTSARSRLKRPQAGFTLLELLVTVVIVSIGLLGIMGLQTVSIFNTQISAARGKAAVAAESMAARIAANPAGAAGYKNISHPAAGSEPTPDCAATSCTPAQLADYDAWHWDSMVGRRLPGGKGYVTCIDSSGAGACRIYRVVVAWSERTRDYVNPTAGADLCGVTVNTGAASIDVTGRCYVMRVRP